MEYSALFSKSMDRLIKKAISKTSILKIKIKKYSQKHILSFISIIQNIVLYFFGEIVLQFTKNFHYISFALIFTFES